MNTMIENGHRRFFVDIRKFEGLQRATAMLIPDLRQPSCKESLHDYISSPWSVNGFYVILS